MVQGSLDIRLSDSNLIKFLARAVLLHLWKVAGSRLQLSLEAFTSAHSSLHLIRSPRQPVNTKSSCALIPRLHDDGAVRNGSAWHGIRHCYRVTFTRVCTWLCGIEWFKKKKKAIP